MAMIVCFICYVSEIKSTKQNLCNHYLLKTTANDFFSAAAYWKVQQPHELLSNKVEQICVRQIESLSSA